MLAPPINPLINIILLCIYDNGNVNHNGRIKTLILLIRRMERKEEALSELEGTINEQGRILKLASISDVVRRDCALLILQAATKFLSQATWSSADSAGGTIRQGLALVLSEVGPGDAHLRTTLLEALQQSSNGRQQLLDIIPYTMPLNESERNEASEHTLQVLREVLLKDSSSLLPIIGCLAAMPLSDEGRSEAWKLALVSLSALSEEDLPAVVQSLLRNVSSKEEASQALHAIRKEVDDTQVLSMVANLVLAGLQYRDNGVLLSEAYIELFQKLVPNELTSDKVTGENSFLLLDLIVLLDLYQRPELKTKLETLMDGLLQSNTFPTADLLTLTATIRPRQRSVLQERVQPTLLELGIFLLLLPVRLPFIDVPSSLSSCIHSFLLELHHRSDRYRQEELIRSLLHLGDEVSTVTLVPSRKRRRGYDERQRHGLHATCQAVQKVIMALTTSNPASIARFKDTLIERLTSQKRGSEYQQVCSILATMMDGVGGLDSTELMILLQKLLFSPTVNRSQGKFQEDATKVSRGLLLAQEMVLSSALSSNDKTCVYEWVLKILLPSNRRTVQPRVGSPGIDFLSTWSKQMYGSQAEVFQHVKMIMANTGLVQMKESYLQKRQGGVLLAYEEVPSCFLSLQQINKTPTKKKKRELLFCVKTFLARRDLPPPSEWPSEVSWISTLVDSYLQQGRNNSSGAKRSNWRPDGWLEASLELPIFPFESSVFAKYSIGDKLSSEALQELRALLMKNGDTMLRKSQMQDLLRLVLALLLSMSLSVVVLRNSHDHFNSLDQSNEEGRCRRNGVLNLLKYQFLKVYAIKGRLELLLSLLSTMALAIKRRGSESETVVPLNSMRKVFDEASNQGRMILSSLLNLSSLLRVGVMKTCLLDDHDDKVLLQDAFKESTTMTMKFEMVLLLRSHVLTYFVANYSTNNVGTVLDSEVVQHISCFMAKLLEVAKPKAKGAKVSQRVFQLTCLLSSYLEYSICVANHAMQCNHGNQLKSSLLQSMLCINNTTTGDAGDLVMQLFDKVLQQLKAAFDSTISMQMAEILAILSQLDPPTIGVKALDVCWQRLHTIYPLTSVIRLSSVSPSFARVSKRFLAIADIQGTSKVLRTSVMKCAMSKVKAFTSHPVTRRSLLILWSLLAQPSAGTDRAFSILSSLTNEIKILLTGPVNGIMDEAPAEYERTSGKIKKKKKKKSDLRLPTIPSLDGGTLVVYTEMTIHMVVSIFAVAQSAVCGSNENPFSHLCVYPKLLGRLLLLVEQNLTLFPRRFVSLLLTSCHQLLDVTVSQAQQCVEWRNAQPLLTATERRVGKTDYASIRFLETLLQDLSLASVGTVVSFCERVSANKESALLFGGAKVTALLQATERTADTMRNIALAHNVVPAMNVFSDRNGQTDADDDDEEEFVVRGFDQDEPRPQAAPDAKRKKRATLLTVQPATNNTMYEEPEAEEFEWREEELLDGDDDDLSADENFSFEVLGSGWGSDDSDSDSSDSGSLQLESGGLFAA